MSIRVLVVDDSPSVRELLRIWLSDDERFELVGEAADGAAGVAAAASSQPDAVVLDVEMPVLTGVQALPQIRAAAPAAGVVMFSSADDPRVARAALAAGATAYLPKDADFDDLLEVLATTAA
jgi:DNA-binding NarL/FixJ family response regulator